MDQYKVNMIDKHLKAMKNDAYYLAQLSGSEGKNINLDEGALLLLKQYYEGKMTANKKYAVISYWCGEVGDSDVWLYDSEKEAIEAMNRLWEKSYNFALEDDNFDEDRSYHEEYEARVAWDDELYRIFEVKQISEKEEI